MKNSKKFENGKFENDHLVQQAFLEIQDFNKSKKGPKEYVTLVHNLLKGYENTWDDDFILGTLAMMKEYTKFSVDQFADPVAGKPLMLVVDMCVARFESRAKN